MPRTAGVLLALLTVGACAAPTPSDVGARYLVTSAPIDLGGNLRQCVGIDPAEPTGVWVWPPGRTGCSSRSSGPTVTRPTGGRVTSVGSGELVVTFDLDLIPARRLDVRLQVSDHRLQPPVGNPVLLVGLPSLELPELP